MVIFLCMVISLFEINIFKRFIDFFSFCPVSVNGIIISPGKKPVVPYYFLNSLLI